MATKSNKSSVSHGKSCGTLFSDIAEKKTKKPKKPSAKKPKRNTHQYLVGYSIWDGFRHRVGSSCGKCYASSEAEAKKLVKSDVQSDYRGSKVKIDYVSEI